MRYPTKESEQETKVKKCLKKRGIKTCHECCRYQECVKHKEVDWRYQNMIDLGNAIVYEIGVAYCDYYRKGCRSKYLFYKNTLRSTYPSIITANQTDGYALEDKLFAKCKEMYGDFDEICNNRVAKYHSLIAEQRALLKTTKDVKKRKVIRDKIDRLMGELYE